MMKLIINPKYGEMRGIIKPKEKGKYFLVIQKWNMQINQFENSHYLRLKGTRKEVIETFLKFGIPKNRILTNTQGKKEDKLIRERRFKLDIEIRKGLKNITKRRKK